MGESRWRQLGLSDDEYRAICEQLGREPNDVELHMYSVMWSEHCSYKHSRALLKQFPTTGPRVVQGPGENAGVVDIGHGWAAVFKIESHNHPSAVEPYQGAATGVGGILRDIFTMGAQPVAFLNSLRFGPLDDAHVRYLFDGVVAGIGGYGNCVGIPTVAGEIYFEPCYTGNPLVNAMCVGVMPLKRLVLGKASGEGNLVVLVGARTGRDGIHGVTFASEELSAESEEKRPAVQVGDPFLGKLLMDATLEAIDRDLVAGVQDLGGAGLTCALTETAARAGTGIEINLEPVPLREEDMEPFEILTSESQERMLLIVEPEKMNAVREVYKRRELAPTVLGKVTGGERVVIFFKDEVIVDLPAESVAGGAPICKPQGLKSQESRERIEDTYDCAQSLGDPLTLTLPEVEDYGEALLKLLAAPDVASKEWVWRRYDYSVRTCTVHGPGGDAAVIRLRETGQALALAVDGNGRHTFLDPHLGGMLAVAEATRNVSCAGAEPIGITDCLNFGNPEKDEIYRQFEQAVAGMAEACRVLETPVVGGNVSFYNEVAGEAIYPTPVVGAVGLLEEAERFCTPAFKVAGDLICLLGPSAVSLGGSQLLKSLYGRVAGQPAPIDLEMEKRLQALLRRLIAGDLVSSAHDLSDGGLAVALAECCLGGNLGATVDVPLSDHISGDLFGEGPTRALISFHGDKLEQVLTLAQDAQVPTVELGRVEGDTLIIGCSGDIMIKCGLAEMKKAYEEVFSCIMS